MARTHHDWLGAEPFTLLLGAGFFGFFAHTGVLAALEEAGIVPRRVVGVSAGALAGGLWAAGVPLDGLRAELEALRREDFWDPGLPLGGLLKGRKFALKLRDLLAPTGVAEVGDCRVPFAAVASDVLRRRAVVLDDGPLELAIRASCTVPLMFRPLRAHGRLLVDGGVFDRPGLSAIASGERVLMHHLPTRSPWRMTRRSRAAPQPVAGRVMLAIDDLPRVGPSRLEHGPPALRHARERALRWLEAPLADDE